MGEIDVLYNVWVQASNVPDAASTLMNGDVAFRRLDMRQDGQFGVKQSEPWGTQRLSLRPMSYAPQPLHLLPNLIDILLHY